ncbi:MAG: glutamyl-tRNA reductase [Bacteroidota bacterium]
MTQEGIGYLFSEREFTVVGISYNELPVEERQMFALSNERQEEVLKLVKDSECPFAMILSTCNRTEFFIEGDYSKEVKAIFEQNCDDYEKFDALHYLKTGKEAVDHVFSIAAGLQSQIPGDFEIIGQLRKAFNRSKSIFPSSAFFERLMNTATQVSKRVKNETEFSSGVTSTAYAAVKCIRERFPNISDEKVLIYGTGKIGANVCQNLVKHVPKENIRIINRSIEKAELLSKKYGIECLSESHLMDSIAEADVIVVATGASAPTLTEDMLPVKGEKYMIDLSLPRNICPELYQSETVLDVDELSRLNDETLQLRLKEVPKVEAIVEADKMKFFEWLDNRRYAPTMQAIQQKLNHLSNRELKKTPRDKEAFNKFEVEELTQSIIKKITGSFYTKIKDMDSDELKLVNQLFDLRAE